MSDQGWIGFVDPYERAFSAETPIGWLVFGGIIRHDPIHPGIYLRAVSPDHRTSIQVGVLEPTTFNTPARSIFGIQEPEGGRVRNYLTGAAYARDYVQRVIPTLYSDIAVIAEKDRPDLAQGPWAAWNPLAHHSGGEVDFTCKQNGEAAVGVMTASTYILPTPANIGGTLWAVEYFGGYVTTPDGADAAFADIVHILGSIRFDPAWLQGVAALKEQIARGYYANATQTMQLAQQSCSQLQQITQFAEQSRARTNARLDRADQQNASFGETISGYSTYADPVGNRRILENTQPYQWMGPNGATVATSGPTSPGIGWQMMTRLPPG